MNIKQYQNNRFELRGVIIHNVFIKVRPLGSNVTSLPYDQGVPGLITHSSVKSIYFGGVQQPQTPRHDIYIEGHVFPILMCLITLS